MNVFKYVYMNAHVYTDLSLLITSEPRVSTHI